jgi:hypothetical protein
MPSYRVADNGCVLQRYYAVGMGRFGTADPGGLRTAHSWETRTENRGQYPQIPIPRPGREHLRLRLRLRVCRAQWIDGEPADGDVDDGDHDPIKAGDA